MNPFTASFIKPLAVLITLTTLALALPLQAQPQDIKKSEAQINEVVESFRTAIIAKDKPRFLALFHGMAIPWLAVNEDGSLAKMRQRDPATPKAAPVGSPGPIEFIDFVMKAPMPIEEKFSNVRITTDGLIASVFFDYTFHQGDYKSNWGTEAWHLLNTDKGWKINSVIYSVTFNPEPPPKRKKAD
jgi:hypothetical protein